MIGIILGIIALVLFIFVGWIIGIYNWFVNGDQNIKTQFSNIKTEYQRRADLFYNLVQAVKAHVKFEKGTLVEVTRMRNVNMGNSIPEGIKKMKGMDGVFSKLMVTFEAYPNLKSIQQFNKFTEETRITEDRINVARTDYNDVVREYNVKIKSFPSSILANMFNFNVEKYYINEEKTEYAPKVDFNDDGKTKLVPHE